MLIPVIYCDHSHDLIESYTLSNLIREGKIKAFKRASGWVQIGKDQIRKYDNTEQGRMVAFPNHENNPPHLKEACL
jgi:hypothetical protein